MSGTAAKVTIFGGSSLRRREECFACSSVGGWSLIGDAEAVCTAGGCSVAVGTAEVDGDGVPDLARVGVVGAIFGVAARSEVGVSVAAGGVTLASRFGTLAAPCGDKEAAGLDAADDLSLAFADSGRRGVGGAVARPERVTVLTIGTSSSDGYDIEETEVSEEITKYSFGGPGFGSTPTSRGAGGMTVQRVKASAIPFFSELKWMRM